MQRSLYVRREREARSNFHVRTWTYMRGHDDRWRWLLRMRGAGEPLRSQYRTYCIRPLHRLTASRLTASALGSALTASAHGISSFSNIHGICSRHISSRQDGIHWLTAYAHGMTIHVTIHRLTAPAHRISARHLGSHGIGSWHPSVRPSSKAIVCSRHHHALTSHGIGTLQLRTTSLIGGDLSEARELRLATAAQIRMMRKVALRHGTAGHRRAKAFWCRVLGGFEGQNRTAGLYCIRFICLR